MSKFPVGLFAIVYCLLPGSAFAQQDRFSPIEILPLADGSFIRFERFSGALLRLKEGRQIARVRLPKATMIERRTDGVRPVRSCQRVFARLFPQSDPSM